ncbi:hypothetical protein MTO96_000498 [Rhipicephalus appendiculatus]
MSGRKRFTLGDDLALAKVALELNPFLGTANRLKIADRLSELLGRSFSLRSVKERLHLILLRFLRDVKKKIKRRGAIRTARLAAVSGGPGTRVGLQPAKATIRLLAKCDGGKCPKGRPRALQQRRLVEVDNREEDALAAYAESTAGDGTAPGKK